MSSRSAVSTRPCVASRARARARARPNRRRRQRQTHRQRQIDSKARRSELRGRRYENTPRDAKKSSLRRIPAFRKRKPARKHRARPSTALDPRSISRTPETFRTLRAEQARGESGEDTAK
eukprot:640092-Rhodomonas_salina.1